ncbi:hypothetical protein Mucpa_0114 [Mucilaginibacter paludis DSM 18603]|uniref:Uncharacterized protein n=1 Tax=Mucilaginibacter paludis DSM 18603 TaxID=714943 RepID=H1YDX7_9SPHI|nr:hypothetical protein Mucpa_0114 [Mucilaginibacter paludis DSM 18603]
MTTKRSFKHLDATAINTVAVLSKMYVCAQKCPNHLARFASEVGTGVINDVMN